MNQNDGFAIGLRGLKWCREGKDLMNPMAMRAGSDNPSPCAANFMCSRCIRQRFCNPFEDFDGTWKKETDVQDVQY